MRPIYISAVMAANFVALRSPSVSETAAKSQRKALWAQIRRDYGIPDRVKLGFVDAPGPNYGRLYDKASGFFLAGSDADGKYAGNSSHHKDQQAAPTPASSAASASASASAEPPVIRVLTAQDAPVRYVAVNPARIADLTTPDDALYGEEVEVVTHASDVGRIAYDAVRDRILVRIDG